MAGVWRLVGREEELQFLRSSLDGGGAVLVGASGVGKTRLAQEVMAGAQGPGDLTRWISASAAVTEVPLGVLAAAVDLEPSRPLLVVRAVMDALTGGFPPERVLLVVDDAHLLDPLSAFVIHQLTVDRRARVLVTLRSDQPVPPPITALWKDRELPRVHLQELAEDEVRELAAEVLGGPLDAVSARRLWQLTRGNVLYLKQLLDSGTYLAYSHGFWQMREDQRMPSALMELIDIRIGAVSSHVATLLDVLTITDTIGVSVLERICDPDAIEEAEDRGLISIERADRMLVRFAHPLYADARRRRLGKERERRLCARIVEAWRAADFARCDDSLQLAMLMLNSGITGEPGVLVAGSREASNRLDLALAERLARAAVAAGGDFDSKYCHAMALLHIGSIEQGSQLLEELSSVNDPARSGRILIARVGFGIMVEGTGPQWRLVDAAVKAGVAEAGAVDACRMILLTLDSRLREALPIAERAIADPALPDTAVMLGHYCLHGCAALLGHAGLIDQHAFRAYEFALRSEDAAWQMFGVASVHMWALRMAGRAEECRHVADHIAGLCEHAPGPAQIFSLTIAAEAALRTGDVRRARDLTAQVLASKALPAGWEAFIRLHRTESLALCGAAEEAKAALTETQAGIHPAYVKILQPQITLASAWVAAADGEFTAAPELARRAADEFARAGQPMGELIALHSVILLSGSVPTVRIAEIADTVEGRLAPAIAAHASAFAARDPDQLIGVAKTFEEIGEPLAAADAAAQASSLYSSIGRRGSALSAAALARRIAERCGADTPALRSAEQPSRLSEREREIAQLAARGFSNREIARRLMISVRTVEGHLYRIGNKVGPIARGGHRAPGDNE